jgi:hypothetical protein
MIRKKYLFDIERDVIKYGDEGYKYKSNLPNKINHTINHKIPHKKDDFRQFNNYLESFESKGRHHLHDHLDKILDGLTNDKKQKERAKQGLVPIFGNSIMKPTHEGITTGQRDFAFMNEASMMYGHGSTEQQIENYLKKNGVKKYNIDFDASTSDALVFVNKQTKKATLAFRGSSLSKHASNDWASNGIIFSSPTLDTESHIKIDNFYNKVRDNYIIENITGYSRGGHFATYLANKYDIPSVVFNPFISVSNIVNSVIGNAEHTIINTTEDIVSPLAPIYALNNKNVKIRTILPITENTSLIDPIAGHANTNFTNENDATRSTGRKFILQERIVSAGKKLGELDIVEKAKIIKENGGSFTDFLKRITPNDVQQETSLIDGSRIIKFSDRIKGGGIETKIWNEVGGEITRLENVKLNENVSIDPVDFETTRLERLDHSNAPQHIRQKNINFLENELREQITELNSDVRESTDFKKLGFTPRSIGSMVIGSVAGSQIEQQQKQLGEFSSGFITSALAGGKMLKGGLGTLGSAELGDYVSSLINDKPTANIVNSAVTLGTLPVTEAVAEFAIGRVASVALGIAVAPFVAPEAAVVGGLALLGAGIGSAGNYFFGNKA